MTRLNGGHHHLVFGVFWHRNGRRELVVAFLTVNVGVLAVTAALSSSTIGAGLGLGLFGILSIIRLRSEELTQREIAYYFAALALGLLAGINIDSTGLCLGLMAAIVVAVVVGDHPRIAPPVTSQEMLLDRALINPGHALNLVRGLLDSEVLGVTIRKVDLVDDTTLVTVRHRPAPLNKDISDDRPLLEAIR